MIIVLYVKEDSLLIKLENAHHVWKIVKFVLIQQDVSNVVQAIHQSITNV